VNHPLRQEDLGGVKPGRTRAQGQADTLVLTGTDLDLASLWRVAHRGQHVAIDPDPALRERMESSVAVIERAVREGEAVYGVTTGFGALAGVAVPRDDAAALQVSLLRALKVGVGDRLSRAEVRAAMLCRANSHLHGGSAIRLEIVSRLVALLNAGLTPHVHEHGSIGASGDLVPLAYIAGCVAGLRGFVLDDEQGRPVEAPEALARLGMRPVQLLPKEGLALVNGTSAMAGIAGLCAEDAVAALAVALGAHAMLIQALGGTNQSFHPFIHAAKPHKGQGLVARLMLELLSGSRMSRDELDGRHPFRPGQPIQDRYSLRCLPQYLGPVVDGLATIRSQVHVELNSLTDNPIVDGRSGATYHGGNFLGQYVAVSMDQLRYYVGLVAKHLDVQIALLVAPEFNAGLPASLIGNPSSPCNLGLKGLQIAGNSIMPLLTFLGAPIADRYPTHAEQFNQNVNSQGMASATLARRSLRLFQSYLGIALIFAVQAVDLRCRTIAGHCDPSRLLSEPTARLYRAIRAVLEVPARASRPYVFDDGDQPLDHHVALLEEDIAEQGRVALALDWLRHALVRS
jgi:phenylalanine ammonia-lyase